MAKSIYNKAIIYSLTGLGSVNVDDLVSELKEEMSKKDMHKLGLNKLAGALLSVSGVNEQDYDWAHLTARILSKALAHKQVHDPVAGEYRHMGFAPLPAARKDAYNGHTPFAMAIPSTSSILLNIEIRERVLPSVSVEVKLREKIAAFEKKEDRYATRKDVAILKEELVGVMLKTAPIRPKFIPVLLTKGMAVFFTSSVKSSEDGCNLLRSALGTFPAVPVFASGKLQAFFKDMLTNDWAFPLEEMDDDALNGIIFHPCEDTRIEDLDDESVVTIKNENLITEGCTCRERLTNLASPVVRELTFIHYPMGATDDVGATAARMVVKMSDSGIIKKFAPAENAESSDDFQLQATNMADEDWMAALTTVWLADKRLCELLRHMAQAGAVERYDLGLGWRGDLDTDKLEAIDNYIHLRRVGYGHIDDPAKEEDEPVDEEKTESPERDHGIDDDMANDGVYYWHHPESESVGSCTRSELAEIMDEPLVEQIDEDEYNRLDELYTFGTGADDDKDEDEDDDEEL